MTNQEQDFNQGTSYVVSSRAFVRVDFGTVDIPRLGHSNAILVEFHGGAEYIYLAVPETLYEHLESVCVAHELGSGASVGREFSTRLFNSYPCYARLHQPNIEV